MLVGNWMDCAALSAVLSSLSNFFFSLLGMVLSALASSISFVMAICGSMSTFVCGSIAIITREILAATASYSAKSLKPCCLMTAFSSASYLARAWFENAALCIFSTIAETSFWAAMNPPRCFSVSMICVAATCADTLVGKLAKTTAIAAMVRRSIWYMAELHV